ncbi:MAG: NAD(P)H-quinone oxidoreductase [Candidatus Poribacteria bacterium]|nr:NAD(P)H-quinone oxidoreductase [Candidatus Poribacteria bacterium]
MKAIIRTGDGGPEVLQLAETPAPRPTATQVLVDVHATALNRADLIQRRGGYPPPPGESEILGLEIAGTVSEVGYAVEDGISKISKGDRVFGLVGGGGYAEQAVIDYRMAMPIPDGWSFEEAAAVPEVFFTANENIFTLGKLSAGETILIHAGGSGVGSAGIQISQHAGATVFVTAGTPEKIDKCKALGATEGINYKTTDFVGEIQRLTDGRGVDVVLDFIGAPYLERNLSILKTKGRLLQVGLIAGATAEINLGAVMRNRLQIIGSVMRPQSIDEKIAITQRFVERWLPELKRGALHPIIDTVFPLAEAQQAHAYMEANRNFGKILLKVS